MTDLHTFRDISVRVTSFMGAVLMCFLLVEITLAGEVFRFLFLLLQQPPLRLYSLIVPHLLLLKLI